MELKDIIQFRTPEIREKINAYGFVKSFVKGDVILKLNAYVKAVPIVLSGAIRVIRTDDDGKEILLYYIQAGESCIMSFLGAIHQDTSKVNAIAEDNTEILFIPNEKVILLVKENPEWLDYIFWLYHKRFEELLEVVNAVTFKKLDERLLAFITRKCQMANSNTIQISHEQLANELGTVRVVVSRLLKQMENEGLVTLGRNKISLVQQK